MNCTFNLTPFSEASASHNPKSINFPDLVGTVNRNLNNQFMRLQDFQTPQPSATTFFNQAISDQSFSCFTRLVEYQSTTHYTGRNFFSTESANPNLSGVLGSASNNYLNDTKQSPSVIENSAYAAMTSTGSNMDNFFDMQSESFSGHLYQSRGAEPITTRNIIEAQRPDLQSFRPVLGANPLYSSGNMTDQKNCRGDDATSFKKKFPCLGCEKSFARFDHLKTHSRIHTGEKPFQCQICDKRFNQSCHLRTHNRIHTGEKSFQCKICMRRFAYSDQLKKHNRSHTGESEKPFQCPFCNKSFASSRYLKKHNRIHTGEKPYQCGTCKMSFAYAYQLRMHYYDHTGEKPPYQCKICEKCYFHSHSLKLHLTRKHPSINPTQPSSTKS